MEKAACPTCGLRPVAERDTVCPLCRGFITEFIESGAITRQAVPMVADVALAMERLGVDQDRAVQMLGGAL